MTPVIVTAVQIASLRPGTPLRLLWWDARHVHHSWTSLSDIDHRPCKVQSVGLFVKATAAEIIIATDFGYADEDEVQANAVSAIPRGCIRMIHQLGDPMEVRDGAD